MCNPEEELHHFPISDELDLHTFNPKDVKELVAEYLYECRKNDIFRIRIIHGKGKSVLKQIVHSQLEKHPLVMEYHDATGQKGGWGATIVYLKQK